MIDVPPMTAAATDGSTETSTSETVAVLTSPATRRARDRREHGRQGIQGHQHLPDPGAGRAARRSGYRRPRTAADRIPCSAGHRMAAAIGMNTEKAVRQKADVEAPLSQMIASGSSVPALRTACW
jgi:hypothetical protein